MIDVVTYMERGDWAVNPYEEIFEVYDVFGSNQIIYVMPPAAHNKIFDKNNQRKESMDTHT